MTAFLHPKIPNSNIIQDFGKIQHSSFKIKQEAREVCEEELISRYYETNKTRGVQGSRIDLLNEINTINVRKGNAREKYYSEETDVVECRAYKVECQAEINRLEEHPREISDGTNVIDKLLKEVLDNLEKLDVL